MKRKFQSLITLIVVIAIIVVAISVLPLGLGLGCFCQAKKYPFDNRKSTHLSRLA